MDHLMLSQTDFPIKPFPTFLTTVPLLTSVDLPMGLQVTLCFEGLSTRGTLKRPLCLSTALVDDKAGLPLEGPFAFSACKSALQFLFVWFLTSIVLFLVALQGFLTAKDLPALPAAEALFTRVDPLMYQEIVIVLEFLITDFALERRIFHFFVVWCFLMDFLMTL